MFTQENTVLKKSLLQKLRKKNSVRSFATTKGFVRNLDLNKTILLKKRFFKRYTVDPPFLFSCQKPFFLQNSVSNKPSLFKKHSFLNLAQSKEVSFASKREISDNDTKRFAFYHAGKCLVQTLLVCHPKTPLFKLIEPKTTFSGNNALSRDLISRNKLLSIETRVNLQSLLIGFYAGKIGEFFDSHSTQHIIRKKRLIKTQGNTLGVSSNKNSQSIANVFLSQVKDQSLYQSDIGFPERLKATSLLQYLSVDGSIYSPNFVDLKKNSILGNLNKTEILERKLFDLFQSLQEEMNTVFSKQQTYNQNSSKSIRGSSRSHRVFVRNGAVKKPTVLKSQKIDIISQNREKSAWFEEMVCNGLTFYKKPYGHWFRIYLPQIETHQRQPVSLDNFFTKSRELSKGTSLTNAFDSHRLQGFALLKGEQSTNQANFCLSLVHPLPCMRLSAKPLVKKQSFLITEFCKKNGFLLQPKRSDLVEHSETISTGSYQEARLQSYFSTVLNINRIKSAQKAQFYTFDSNFSNIVTQASWHLWPPEFGHGTSYNLGLNTFSRAFYLIGKNREFLDILADHFIRFGKVRMPEISRICSLYADMVNLQEQSSSLSEGSRQNKIKASRLV